MARRALLCVALSASSALAHGDWEQHRAERLAQLAALLAGEGVALAPDAPAFDAAAGAYGVSVALAPGAAAARVVCLTPGGAPGGEDDRVALVASFPSAAGYVARRADRTTPLSRPPAPPARPARLSPARHGAGQSCAGGGGRARARRAREAPRTNASRPRGQDAPPRRPTTSTDALAPSPPPPPPPPLTPAGRSACAP